MLTPSDIALRLVQEYQQLRYRRCARHIADTAPLQPGDHPFLLLSMVQKSDLASYLVALKSFAAYLNPSRVVIVCDPSIDPSDRAFLLRHVPHAELRDAVQFRHPGMPVGGCWERLHAICQYAATSYVIQLDADTVTLNMPSEVLDSIRANAAFVMAGETDQCFMTLPETADLSEKTYPGNPHIQCALELALPHAGLPADARYVRGCAAFAGFPQSAAMVEHLLEFASALHRSLGPRWAVWGTEQGASNYLIANASAPTLLPFPKYGTPDVMGADAALVHFIGSMRFVDSRYRVATGRVIGGLLRGGAD